MCSSDLIFMHPRTWEASGHVGAFNDPLIDNRDSKKRYRADVLIEEFLAKQDEKIEKEVEKARKRFGEQFDEEQYRATSDRVKEIAEKRGEIHSRMVKALTDNDLSIYDYLAQLVQIVIRQRLDHAAMYFAAFFGDLLNAVARGAVLLFVELLTETLASLFDLFFDLFVLLGKKFQIGRASCRERV